MVSAGRALTRIFGAILLASLPVVALGQEPQTSLAGRWRLETRESFSPYGSKPESGALVIRVDDGRIFDASDTVTRQGGKTETRVMLLPVDGQFHSVLGTTVGIVAAVADRSPGRIKIEFRAGELRATEVCTRQADRLTCTEVDQDGAGRQSYGKAVYTLRSP